MGNIKNKYQDYKKRYRDLEMSVFSSLRDEINKSTYVSSHVDTKSIKVDLYSYTELLIINDRLTFLDSNGYSYSIFAECSIEDLIEILAKI